MSIDAPWIRNLKGERAIVLGGGIAGLSAAISLALRGARVTVLERRPVVGGSVGRIERHGWTWDAGPAFVRYPQAFTKLWSQAGLRFSDFVDLRPLDPLYRAVFSANESIDVWSDPERLRDEIARLDTTDAERFGLHVRRAQKARAAVEQRHFLLPKRGWGSDAPGGGGLFGASASPGGYLASLKRQFKHPRTVALLAFEANALGWGPAATGSIARFLPALEWKHEAWYPAGGMSDLVAAFVRLAELTGVGIETQCEVERITASKGGVQSVSGTGFETISARIVVSTIDPETLAEDLLDGVGAAVPLRRRVAKGRPGMATLAVHLGTKKRWPILRPRTVFFSTLGNEEEFRQISGWNTPASMPTVEVTCPGLISSLPMPEGKMALRLQASMPSLSSAWRWTDSSVQDTRDRMVSVIEKSGIPDMEKSIEAEVIQSPLYFRDEFLYADGDMHGRGYGDGAEFMVKAPNRVADIPGLFLAGRGAHPGAMPALACLGGMHAANCAAKDFGQGR